MAILVTTVGNGLCFAVSLGLFFPCDSKKRLRHATDCPSARAGVQAEWARSRGTGCTERSGGSWAEGAPQRAEGGALSFQKREKG